VNDPTVLVINTCGRNDTTEKGDATNWVWSNPTNRIMTHGYAGITAVSVECLWQGTKLLEGQTEPDLDILQGNWRKHKGKRPIGAWAGKGQPLITNPGEARRQIYIPAYMDLIEHWLQDDEVFAWIQAAQKHPGDVVLRDHDTGRGIDRNGPMSHAWLLCTLLNRGITWDPVSGKETT